MNKKLLVLVLAFLGGVLLVLALRFALVKNHEVHYHANFALYVNGQQDKFDNFTFYEEVAACNANESNDPKHRAHMHDNNNHVVHVHAAAVTWGDFFANLGYGLSGKALTTDAGTFVDGLEGKKLSFILNGQAVDSVANRVIGDRDVLLISYGSENQSNLMDRYKTIPKDAEQFDKNTDPAACSGPEKLDFTTRLKHVLNFSN